ncbi:MAG: hypothetical protein ACTSRS_19635 [Candidatus Helarchaeota archaeon]
MRVSTKKVSGFLLILLVFLISIQLYITFAIDSNQKPSKLFLTATSRSSLPFQAATIYFLYQDIADDIEGNINHVHSGAGTFLLLV